MDSNKIKQVVQIEARKISKLYKLEVSKAAEYVRDAIIENSVITGIINSTDSH